ncbi:MAG: sigma-70 family RNA polymerase sigma factor [Arachidicoccus sp.]|nr:sigma-70 family RNA polymerase sigma factor [Arachidicoccus sp.]
MEIYTDTNIIHQLQEDDERAFAYVYEKYHNAVYANILKLVGNKTDAEDILQDVFVLLWNNRLKFTERHKIAGWLFSASYYKSLEFLRKSVKRSILEFENNKFDIGIDTNTIPDTEMVYEERLAILNNGIEQLSPQKKSAFTLCRIYGKSYEEAADQMGLSAETIKGYVKDSAKFLKHYASIQAVSPVSAFTLYCLISFFLI